MKFIEVYVWIVIKVIIVLIEFELNKFISPL